MAINRFTITRKDLNTDPVVIESEGLTIGRLTGNDLVLNHPTVSRTQAGIKKVGADFWIFNLSEANGTLLNGQLVESAPLADGDSIQIGPFFLRPSYKDSDLAIETEMTIKPLPMEATPSASSEAPVPGEAGKTVRLDPALLAMLADNKTPGGTKRLRGTGMLKMTGSLAGGAPKSPDLDEEALKVFWDKRKREAGKLAEESPLKPQGGRRLGKAQFNWRPTRDLQHPWPKSLFVWGAVVVIVLSSVAVFAFKDAYSPGALSTPHMRKDFSIVPAVAKETNAGSCTTCHSVKGSMQQNCSTCHTSTAFHSEVSQKHMAVGLTCTACHDEHQGRGFRPALVANDKCTSCHTDGVVSNGKTLKTPHGGVVGYPVLEGKWQWEGLQQADWQRRNLPGNVSQFSTKDQFHLIHVAGRREGRSKCSDCHTAGFEGDAVRLGVRESCADCHSLKGGASLKRQGEVTAGCVGCHAQHGEEKELRSALRRDLLTPATMTGPTTGK